MPMEAKLEFSESPGTSIPSSARRRSGARWRLRAAGRLLVGLTALSALGACAVTSDVFLRQDGSGITSVDVDFSPELVAAAQDVAGLSPDGDIESEPMYNRINERPGVTAYRVLSPPDPRIQVAFGFDNARTVLPPGIVSFHSVEEGTLARLYLDVNRARMLPSVFPILDHPALRAIGPLENTDTTEEEFLAMIGVLMGADGAQALADSMIVVRISVMGEVVSQRGGRIEDGSVVFEVPVLDLMLLHEPIDLEVVFR